MKLGQVPMWTRNRKLLALTKTSPSDSFHGFIDIETVGRIDLANQGVGSCRRPQRDFKRTAVPGVVLENLQADVSNCPPLRGEDPGNPVPHHKGAEAFFKVGIPRFPDQDRFGRLKSDLAPIPPRSSGPPLTP